jgi:hypothetical protein
MTKLREERPERKDDYLKYWRSIYHYTKVKHNISSADLDMLLFLYSEPYFTTKTFLEFNKVLAISRTRLKKMVDAGWIDIFRKSTNNLGARYQLSRKAAVLVTTLYRQLNGGPVVESNEKLFQKKNKSYMDKRYAEQLHRRNELIQLQRRQTLEAQYTANRRSS